jgi:Tfp pilus assembly protein PilF
VPVLTDKGGVISYLNPVATALIIASMSSGDSAQRWLEKGAEAYAKMRLDEAGQDFHRAVEADPDSAKAQLSLRVIYLFQYQNGVAEQLTEWMT